MASTSRLPSPEARSNVSRPGGRSYKTFSRSHRRSDGRVAIIRSGLRQIQLHAEAWAMVLQSDRAAV